MRTVLLGLFLANALYWGWSQWIDKAPVLPITASDSVGVPTLQLVSESELAGSALDASADSELDIDTIEPLILDHPGTSDVMDASAATGEQMPTTAAELLREPVVDAADMANLTADTAAVRTAPENVGDSNAPSGTALIQVDPIEYPQRCVSVGPFLNLRQASEAASLLTRSGLTTSQRVEEAEVWVGHWVHLPSFPTRAEAIAVVERLREGGVRDIYIEPSGELRNSISLGLFSDIERAEIRAGQVRKLDVRPQIQDRRREGLVYWVDSQIEAGFDVDINTFDPLPNQDLRRIVIPCADDKTVIG